MARTKSSGRRTPAAEPPATATPATPTVASGPDRPRRLGDLGPLPWIRAAHPRQAVVTAAGLAAVAALDGRPAREVAVVLATVLVGQAVLGWHNDLVDRERDRRHDLPGKPVASGRLDPGSVWFVLICAVLLLVPLSISTGITAGAAYLVSVAVGLLGNTALRTGFFSWVPWAVAFALYPAYLSYGGWGGATVGDPPEVVVTVLFALLGVGVHVFRALWGLVPDNADGWTYLPLKLGLRLGAGKLLVVSSLFIAVVLAALALAGTRVGLSQ